MTATRRLLGEAVDPNERFCAARSVVVQRPVRVQSPSIVNTVTLVYLVSDWRRNPILYRHLGRIIHEDDDMARNRPRHDEDGRPERATGGFRPWMLALAILPALGLGMAGTAWIVWPRARTPDVSHGEGVPPPEMKPAEPDPVFAAMTAMDLCLEWERNPAAGAAKYRKNGVVITGYLHQIAAAGNQTFIQVIDGDPDRITNVLVSGKAAEDLMKLQIRDRITVKAVSTGRVTPHPWLTALEMRVADGD